MRYATLLTIVEQLTGLERPQAERAIEATLRTLAERITGGEARDIAAFLPPEMRGWMAPTPEPAEPFDRREFVRRVAEREEVDPDAAEEHVRAVFQMLGFAVAPGELRDMASQLPKDFEDLLEAAGAGGRRAMTQDDVVGRVAELLHTDRETARRATEAVLQTLAVRISNGEVEDLEAELPADLHAALERGLAESRAAKKMSEEEFLARVAELEGTGPEEAERHAHAVFQALREALSPKEFSDMTSQLSEDYAALLV
ncbi:MAG: hypothetical protein JWO74_4324 [Solirubrobacterales bacterium]|jgi:uncharacterized protein (DUF2267 family)|nr:hypothetical protein [Solirubrobacterales bacterium]